MSERSLDTNITYTSAQQGLMSLLNATAGWGEHAMCVGDDRFTDEPMTSKAQKQLDEDLRTVCNGCPVRLNCLMHALDFPEMAGFWGGFNRQQRLTILKTRTKFPMARAAIMEVARNDSNRWSDS